MALSESEVAEIEKNLRKFYEKLPKEVRENIQAGRSARGQTARARKLANKVLVNDRLFSKTVSKRVAESSFIARVTATGRASDFAAAMQKYPDIVMNRLEELLDKVADSAMENVIARTPVLTGAAQAGWKLEKINKYRRFIENNEPHIRRLEHGWSKQPNRGFMVRSTVKRIPQFVDKAAAELQV